MKNKLPKIQAHCRPEWGGVFYLEIISLGSELGDTPHCEAVVTVGVVGTWVHVATVDVQAVRVGTTVRRT